MKYLISVLAIIASGAGLSVHDTRIINGTATTIESFPWQFSHRLGGNHICGGSILTATRGLTLASCFRFSLDLYSALVGATNRTDLAIGFHTDYSRVVKHSGFNFKTFRDNIAVVWFENKLPLSSKIWPVRIPAQDRPDPIPAIGLLSGWGFTDPVHHGQETEILRFARLALLTRAQCQQAYGGKIASENLCAGNLSGGRNGCIGDGGGALIVNGVQHGIYAWTLGCGKPGRPGVFTRVSNYTHWIQESIR